jgi:hypothetical protein
VGKAVRPIEILVYEERANMQYQSISFTTSLDRRKAKNLEHFNTRAHIRYQCRKTTVLSCHRSPINTGVEK